MPVCVVLDEEHELYLLKRTNQRERFDDELDKIFTKRVKVGVRIEWATR